jgi:uncharacterized protein YbjQ (UPF0145 family)
MSPLFGSSQEVTPQGMPAEASDRLKSGTFTSDLTVDEVVCLENMEVDPLGLVLGSSIYHMGLQWSPQNKNQELTVLSQAMYQARSLAINRMEQEAETLQADGIVGVRFDINRYEWGPDLLEFMVIGTAVRSRDPKSSLKPAHGRPFSSALSGQDLWKLRYAGYRPVRLAMGSCVYHVSNQSVKTWYGAMKGNMEMDKLTQGTYTARELAMKRMEVECTHSGGQGVVGVRIEEKSHGWLSHIIEFFAIGTAVVKDQDAVVPPSPNLVLSLDA